MQPHSTSNFLVKVICIARNVQKLLIEKCGLDNLQGIDMRKIKGLARDYFLLQRKKSAEKEALKEQALQRLWLCVSESVTGVLQYAHRLTEPFGVR